MEQLTNDCSSDNYLGSLAVCVCVINGGPGRRLLSCKWLPAPRQVTMPRCELYRMILTNTRRSLGYSENFPLQYIVVEIIAPSRPSNYRNGLFLNNNAFNSVLISEFFWLDSLACECLWVCFAGKLILSACACVSGSASWIGKELIRIAKHDHFGKLWFKQIKFNTH